MMTKIFYKVAAGCATIMLVALTAVVVKDAAVAIGKKR